ncbi:ATP-binding protein [Psychromonas sp. CD1]|uniref:ATP-binding protein n=1 Tax=Psychromonas sp. CD1 TaxID=1979839 RepID=UPI000B9AE208|nr:ATP-binding protein [Psychromonas sp. CD1]
MLKLRSLNSLIVQITIVMLLGLSALMFLSLQLYSSDRQQAVRSVSTESTLQRIGALIEILYKTPDALHQEIVLVSQGLQFKISLDTSPLIFNNQRPDLSEQLQYMLRDQQINDIRIVSYYKKKGCSHQRHNRNSGRRNRQLSGSILLSPSLWLNFDSSINAQVEKISLKTIFILIALTLIILLSMAWLVKRALKPIAKLAIAAERIGSERDFCALAEQGPSEILPTIRAFNNMQQHLSTFIEDRGKMLAAISHDLRTPITSLRLRLEFIEPSPDQHQMLNTLKQMEDMIQATLRFARDDAQKEKKQRCDINTLLSTICQERQEQGISIKLQCPDNLIFRVWPLAIRRVIENLINNSLSYAKDENGIVNISIYCILKDEKLQIKVCDQGKGIAEKDFEEVFKPFVRLDKARDVSDASVGLGLAISRSIVQAHAGTLCLSNNPKGGLCATICLPILDKN